MLLDRFYKISEKTLNISTIGLLLITIVMILYFSFFYFYIILINIFVFFFLALFFKKFIFYSVSWIIILVCLLSSWETIDTRMNKSKYYNTFQPLMKYECIAGYDFTNEQITQNVHCKSMNITEKDSIKTCKLYNNNNTTVKHLKQLGCYSVTVSENLIQLWYDDFVIDLKKDNNKIHYHINELH